MPQPGEIYAHQESGFFYRVFALNQRKIVYTRIGDGFHAQLSLANFANRFRPATNEESEQVQRAEPLLEQQRLPASLANVNAVLNAQSSANDGSEVHAGQPPRRRRTEDDNEAEVGSLVETTDLDVFENLILYPETVTEIQTGLRSVARREDLERVWRFSAIQPLSGRCVINFYGLPGTGKTRAARAIARQLGKKLYQVDYSQIISKYYGDTAKHIKAAFDNARAADAVLFFDEADALLSKRIDMSATGATSINQNRNVLMQSLDAFNGVVIVCTNLFQNYDEALLRRIARHVEFKAPNKEMRTNIFKKHIPCQDRCRDVDFDRLAEACVGFSGGDILNVCINGMQAASEDEDPANWWLTQDLLMAQIQKIKAAKAAHRSKKKASPALKTIINN
jgi:DNA replication protein DnaC